MIASYPSHFDTAEVLSVVSNSSYGTSKIQSSAQHSCITSCLSNAKQRPSPMFWWSNNSNGTFIMHHQARSVNTSSIPPSTSNKLQSSRSCCDSRRPNARREANAIVLTTLSSSLTHSFGSIQHLHSNTCHDYPVQCAMATQSPPVLCPHAPTNSSAPEKS
eukprot:scaffold140221_cov79-Cyclotella_meneghiniana.AAC.1